jgi:hypothetical protein
LRSVWRAGRSNLPLEVWDRGTFSEFAAACKGKQGPKASQMTAHVHALVKDADEDNTAQVSLERGAPVHFLKERIEVERLRFA